MTGFKGESDNFNDILEQCIESVQSGRLTIEECIAQFPQYSELGDLLRLATSVTQMPRPMMPVAFTTKTQQQLESQLRASLRAARPTSGTARLAWMQRLAFIFTVCVLVVFAGTAGIVYAAQDTLPGDSLYNIKRSAEQIKLSFASSDSRRDVLYSIADTRLTELDKLAHEHKPVSNSFVDDMLASVDLALSTQKDNAARTRLLATAFSALQAAKDSGVITPELADRTLSHLQIMSDLYIKLPNTTTPTATTVVSAVTSTLTPTLTSTYTATATETLAVSNTATVAATQTTVVPRTLTTAPLTTTQHPPVTTTAHVISTLTPTATMGQGSARIVTGIPTGIGPTPVVVTGVPAMMSTLSSTSESTATTQVTVEATVEATTASTDEPTETETTPTELPTVEATNTSTNTATPTFTLTFTPTQTPTSTPTSTFTSTFTNTPVPPSATPTPNGLPAANFKQEPKLSTFQNCPPAGKDGDPNQNQVWNRIDDGNYQTTQFDAIANLSWPSDVEGKIRSQWPQPSATQIAQWEGLPILVDAYLVKVQEDGPEAQNCASADYKTWQLWVLGTPGTINDLSRALIIQMTPRVRANHSGWTLDKLNALASKNAKLRIGGWLSFNPNPASDVHKSRISLWEIHPVMQIAVQQGDQWQNLDNFQP